MPLYVKAIVRASNKKRGPFEQLAIYHGITDIGRHYADGVYHILVSAGHIKELMERFAPYDRLLHRSSLTYTIQLGNIE